MSLNERLSCPRCGFDVTDLLCAHPAGYATACALAIGSGLPCCGHQPTNEELKSWGRVVYAAPDSRIPHQRAIGECKVIGTHEEALYLDELRALYREDRDPDILAEAVEDHGLTADEWERGL